MTTHSTATTPTKKTRTVVIVVTVKGVYKYIDDQHEGCITWDAKCYRDIIVMNSSTVTTGIGPNGEQDGNFEIRTSSTDPGQLTIYKETGEWNTTFTHFVSHTAEGYSSIFSYQ